MGTAVGKQGDRQTHEGGAKTARDRRSPSSPVLLYPDSLQLRERLHALESRFKATSARELPQPKPPRDCFEDPSLSPIKPFSKAAKTSATRIIRHGSQLSSPAGSPKVTKKPVRKGPASNSPNSRSQLLQASNHLFNFASRLIDEKQRFLTQKTSEELRLLKAKEDLIREQMNVSRGHSALRVGQSVPATPTHRQSSQAEVEELISEAEQRLNLLSGENSGVMLEVSEASKESNCFCPNVSSIQKMPTKAAVGSAKKRTGKPGIVHVDLSSASKVRSTRERSQHKRFLSDSPTKTPEVKDLLVLLQESSIEDTPKPIRRR